MWLKDEGFDPQKRKNPPEAGSLNRVPEPGQKCREHFCSARLRDDPQGEPQGCGEIIERSRTGSTRRNAKTRQRRVL
jgi:hypothetical protein